jgi:hypothetical protein
VQQTIRELDLPNFIGLLRSIEMAKGKSAVAEKPTKASKKAKNVEVEDEEEEDEEPVKAKASTKTKERPSEQAMREAKATSKKKAAQKEEYVPNKNSMRDFAMRAMKKGGTATAIKKRAASYAEKAGIDTLSDPKAFKNFDIAFFAKMLQGKGYDIDIDEENDKYQLN